MTDKVRNFEIYMWNQDAKCFPPSLKRRFGGGHSIRRIYTRLPKWVVHTGVALYTQWSYVLSIIHWLVRIFTKRRFRTQLLLSLLLVCGAGGYCFYLFQELYWKQLGVVCIAYWTALVILLIFRNRIDCWKERTCEKAASLNGTGSAFRGYMIIHPKVIREIPPEETAEILAQMQKTRSCVDLY